ncbi:hypothetical protein AYI68_g6406 [Smittium mucronatum]|uniref:Uncharacterized protein n=1 Tax=Smittium mucronatum TaxID=133383 RepID=A0A1R0GRJ5_9FUNG|nr:hypothetical protein AYI68_g6406 [Smittium mucronatum]
MISREEAGNTKCQLNVYIKLRKKIGKISVNDLSILGYPAAIKSVETHKSAIYQCIKGGDYLTDFLHIEIKIREKDFLQMISRYDTIEEAINAMKYCPSILNQYIADFKKIERKLEIAMKIRYVPAQQPEYKFFPPMGIAGWDPKKKSALANWAWVLWKDILCNFVV